MYGVVPQWVHCTTQRPDSDAMEDSPGPWPGEYTLSVHRTYWSKTRARKHYATQLEAVHSRVCDFHFNSNYYIPTIFWDLDHRAHQSRYRARCSAKFTRLIVIHGSLDANTATVFAFECRVLQKEVSAHNGHLCYAGEKRWPRLPRWPADPGFLIFNQTLLRNNN